MWGSRTRSLLAEGDDCGFNMLHLACVDGFSEGLDEGERLYERERGIQASRVRDTLRERHWELLVRVEG